MSGGGPVPRDDTTNPATLPWPTRLRLMIEELWDEFSSADPVQDAACHALTALHQHAREQEERDLARTGTSRHYYAFAPLARWTRPRQQA